MTPSISDIASTVAASLLTVYHPWYHPYCFHDSTTTIPVISPTIFDITATVCVSSHPLYRWHHMYGSHHTWHTNVIMNTQHDITFTLYDINPHHLWHHNHCIHDITSPIYDITSTVYDISSTVPLISQPLYQKHHTHYACEFISTIYEIKHTVLRRYNHYIWHHTLHTCICVITPTLSVIYTHCMYDITHTICMAHYALYKKLHPLFMTSQHSIHDIKATIFHITPTISDSTSTLSVSSHPDYSSYNPHCMYVITNTICMTSYEWHMISRPLFISHHSMTSHPLYSCHHTQVYLTSHPL